MSQENSHIQMPRLILKNFHNEENELYYFDFLKKTNFQNGDNPPTDYEEVAYTYLYALISRALEIVEEMKHNSSFFQLLPIVDQHDIAAHDVLVMAKERRILGEYKVALLINNTTEQFVLPAGGIVQYGTRLVCPISPWRGIVFDKHIVTKSEAEIRLFEFQTVNEIVDINTEAVRQEQVRNKKYIVASEKEVLRNLLNDLDMTK